MKRAAAFGVLLALLGAASALTTTAACSLVATFDDRPSRDGGPVSNDGAPAADTGLAGDGSVNPGVYPNGCRGHAGPEPVDVVGFCIDSTEVTNGQYAQFIEATAGGQAGGQATVCSSNATYVPQGDWPVDASKASLPVVEVDWCDAAAFCQWAGKRLCGKLGGGSSAPDEGARITSQWFLACSTGGTRAFPYAPSYDEDACNGDDKGSHRPVAAGSMATCEGGFAGLFDMSGNVAEWEDACDGATGATDRCMIRGGAFQSNESALACASDVLDARSAVHDDVGFRCCSP
jgi:formylglycine-generating enzyme